MTDRPAEHAHARDREFERIVRDHFTGLVDDFVARGFKRREARLWVGAWRHSDHPDDLARAALAFRQMKVESGQAIPWYWERIDPEIAVQYLPHRWRAAEARRVMQALQQQQHDPNLSRRQALHLGLRWAQAGFTADETLHAIAVGAIQQEVQPATCPTGVTSCDRWVMTNPVEGQGEVTIDPVSGLPTVSVGRPISAADVAEALDDE